MPGDPKSERMKKVVTNAYHTKEVLKTARKFYFQQPYKGKASATFGYFTDHPIASLNKKRLNTIIQKTTDIQKKKQRPLLIADLACGAGVISNALSFAGNKVVGIDADRGEIRLAKQFTKEVGQRTQFLIANLMKEGWEIKAEKILGRKPDLIILAYALHHFEEPSEIINRLSGWLKRGAILLINEENTLSPLWRIKHIIRTLIQKDTHFEHQKSFEQWRKILSSYNFQTISYYGLDPLPLFEVLLPKLCWSIIFAAIKK